MERFKACEKEIKTKAYSKEGLSQQDKKDPKDKERQKIVLELNSIVDQLTTQIDKFEAEAESIQQNMSYII